MNSEGIIRRLQLKPHPEGGYYRETYRSNAMTGLKGNARNVCTAIYYLLENDDRSMFHRLKSDELWFFHSGVALQIVSIVDDKIERVTLGRDIANGEVLQVIIPAHTWFAARVKDGKGYGLVSCTVAPGFDFSDFEIAKRNELLHQYPALHEVIERFTNA